MEKDKILNYAKEYLGSKYSEEKIEELAKSSRKFFSTINSLDYYQIKKVLEKKPEFSNCYYDGWHSIHYACLTNNSEIVHLFVNKAINEGKLTHFPQTKKSKKEISENVSTLNFCAALDLDKSFAKLLSFMENVQDINFNTSLRYAFAYNSKKVALFLKPITEDKDYQEQFLKMFMEPRKTHQIYVENFKFNPEKFEDWSVNTLTKLENGENYFTSTLKMCYAYSYDIEEDIDINKFKKTIMFFLDKGFTLETKDDDGKSARELLESLKSRLNSFSFREKFEDIFPEFEKKSLENQLSKENNIKKVKIKI